MRLRLVLKRINDGDVRLDLDGLAVENRWVVAPLSDGVLSGAKEERIAADRLQGLNRAVCRDDRAQFHLAFATSLSRERRIDGLDALDEHGLFEVRYKQAVWRLRAYFRGTLRLTPVVVERNARGAGSVRPAIAWIKADRRFLWRVG